MRSLPVFVQGVKEPIAPAPGFLKKGLAHYHFELDALCGFGCTYCSSNTGNFLRINRRQFASITEAQTGKKVAPVDIYEGTDDDRRLAYARDPSLHIRFRDAVERLAERLDSVKPSFGAGKTIVVSMLTDAFAPTTERSGATKQALDLLISKTSLRIRVLTKSDVVGHDDWIEYFYEHRRRVTVGLSIGNLDRDWARQVEIGTSSPAARVRALHKLQDNGIPTFGMLCPIFPHVTADDGVERLVEAIRPEQCEDIWAEPYNDRQNARAVMMAGYDTIQALPWKQWMVQAFGIDRPMDRMLWSTYATELYRKLIDLADREGWTERLHYLLYEGNIQPENVWSFDGLRGVLLQGPKDENGWSNHPGFAKLEKGDERVDE